MSGIRGIAVPRGVHESAAVAAIASPGRRSLPRALQAALILVRVLFAVTVVGAVDVLAVASSVDAVDGRLSGMLLYAALPGIAGIVLAFYARTGGVRVRWGLLAVHGWLVLGALASLGGDGSGTGVAQLVLPAAVIVLLLRASAREWFRLPPEQRPRREPFGVARGITWRRDSGQSAMEYLGLVLVVAALIGGLVATGIGAQLTGEMRGAICALTGSACPATGHDVVADDSSRPRTGSGGADSGGGSASGGSASGGSASGGAGSEGATAAGGTDSGGSGGSGGPSGSSASSGSGGTSTEGSTTGSTEGSTTGSAEGATTGSTDATTPQRSQAANKGSKSSKPGSSGNFFTGLVGDGLWGDLSGVAGTVVHPLDRAEGIGDSWLHGTRDAGDKWSQGDYAGAVWDWAEASGGGGGAGMGLPGAGTRVGQAVTQAERDHLDDRIPRNAGPAQRKAWWDGLSEQERQRYLEVGPDRIGNLDGIPAKVRDAANRENLKDLMAKLEGKTDDRSVAQLAGMREIDRQLKEKSLPPMFLLGIGDEGNGRAIVSYGDPDEARNVSAYVPGLNTSLDEEFAKNDLKRARDTAIGAQGYEESTAAIVWLGYDAPQAPDGWSSLAVMGDGRAEEGGAAYSDFMGGIAATNQHRDPHITAIGHSYGSRTVGAATQRDGGIPGVDDIILVGSPGVGVDHAVDLGVGSGHVFVGAAKNDVVTKLPSKGQVVAGGLGMLLGGPAGAYFAGDLADPGDDDLWFGKDPAGKAFGATRFPSVDGPAPVSGDGFSFDAHSLYFDPVRDAVSADSIALIVSGHSDRLKMEVQR